MPEPIGSLRLTNGSPSTHGKMNGQSAARQRPVQRRKGFAAFLFDAAARLTVWAVILTIIFRCPSTLDQCDETSPVVCEHYFRARSLAAPYVQPFYDQKVAPYVDVVKPYYAVADARVLSPARAYAVEYGGPLVDKVRHEATQQWMRHAQPTVTKVQDQLQDIYGRYVSPYLETLSDLSQPVLRLGLKVLQQLYLEVLLPLLELMKPYALQGYQCASDFTTEKALPAVQWTWSQMTDFLDQAVWPQVRMVYNENIEPQLVRIGERLERYKNKAGAGLKSKTQTERLSQKTTQAGVPKKPAEPPLSSFVRPPPQSTSLPAPIAAADIKTPTSSARSDRTTNAPWKPVRAPVASENETEQRRKAREMVSQDLDMWQNKFAAQADEGALAIEEHIDEIAERMINEGVVGKGQGLLRRLESTTELELSHLRKKILSIVVEVSRKSRDLDVDAAGDQTAAPLNSDSEPGVDTDIDVGANATPNSIGPARAEADEEWRQVVSAVRSAGVAIKQAARAVRDWRETYETELQAMVLEAANVHFQILDETRGLALQQIGMKWAWTDGVTYKDWAKYHDLKKTLSEWTEELKKLIVTNPTLLQAQEASAQVEEDGMVIASAAALELARLKEVAHFKMLARDTSDSFDLAAMKRAAEGPHEATDSLGLDSEQDAGTAPQYGGESAEQAEWAGVSTRPRATQTSFFRISNEAATVCLKPSGTGRIDSDDYITESQSTSSPMHSTGFAAAQGFIFEGQEQTVVEKEIDDAPRKTEGSWIERVDGIDSGVMMSTAETFVENATDENASRAMVENATEEETSRSMVEDAMDEGLQGAMVENTTDEEGSEAPPSTAEDAKETEEPVDDEGTVLEEGEEHREDGYFNEDRDEETPSEPPFVQHG